jgi:TP901 family phage tail tape measure protein
MANTKIEDLRFTIYINNQQANKALIDLDTVTRKLEADIKQMINTGQHETTEYKEKKNALGALTLEYKQLDTRQKELTEQTKKLISEGKKESAEYALVRKEFDQVTLSKKKAKEAADLLQKEINQLVKEGRNETQEYKELNAAMAKNKIQMEAMRKEAGLNSLSTKQLTALRTNLRRELSMALPGSEHYKKLEADLIAVNNRMKQLNGTAKGLSFGKIADGFNKYFAIGTAAIASFTGIAFSIKKLSEEVAKMDDIYSDVMKTTGLTRDAVVELNEEFKKMDTRTSREDLNKLASEAGKLGIEGKENIMNFVDAGNQIRVALGEDLGEDAIKNIGKMVGVFSKSSGELKDLSLKEQMLSVGSAINQLGASSSASEEYLVQFAGRLGGVATQANISISAILGYGSALDQDMQQVEMSATALQNFIMKLMGDPAKFAKIAGLEVGKFTQLLKTDANTAIKQILLALNEKGGFQQLVPIFEDMGLEGARATGVLSSMAGSIGKIEEAQRIANTAMVEGTSITKEYDIKNDNLAAKLDKAKKRFKEIALELGEKLAPAMTAVTGWGTRMLKIIGGVVDLFVKYKNGIISLTAGIAAYTVVVKAAKYWDDAYYYLLVAKDKAAKIYSVTVGIITGKIKLATVAQQAWNTAKSAGAGLWGILIAAIVAAGVYMVKFSKSMHEEEKVLTDFKNKLSEVVSESNSLFEQLKKTNPGTKERAELIGLINEKYGDYLEGINLEVAGLKQIEDAQQRVNNKLIENLVLEAKQAEVKELAKAQADILLKLGEKGIYLSDLTEGKGALKKYVIWADQEIQLLSDGYFNLEQQIASVGDKYNEVAEGIRKSLTPGSYTNTGPKEGDTKTEDGISYVYKNGAWEIVQNKGGGSGESLKKLEELKNKTADIRRQMYIDTLSDNEKELTIIRDKFDKELLAAGITYDKIMQLRKMDPAKMSAEEKIKWDYYLSINDQQNAEIQAKKAEQLEKLQAQEDDYQSKKDAAREEILKATMSDEDAELKAARDKYINLKELATMFGLDMSKIIELQGAEEEAIKQKYRQKEKDADAALKKTLADNEQKLYDQKVSVISAASNTLGNIMELMGKKSQEDTAFYKALGLAQIAIDTGIAVAAGVRTVMASNTSVSPWEKIAAVIAIAGEIIGTITSATSILNKADVPTYASGGPTGRGSYIDETGERVAGVVHEEEYIIPRWQRKLPEVQAMEKRLEYIRQHKYMSGGSVANISGISSDYVRQYHMNTSSVIDAVRQSAGYYNSKQSSISQQPVFSDKSLEIMQQFTTMMQYAVDNGLKTNFSIYEHQKAVTRYEDAKKTFGS